MNITKNITTAEVACRCGCGQTRVSQRLMEQLQCVRDMFALPIIIHCVNRCLLHNESVGGHSESLHLEGRACDFHIKRMSVSNLHWAMNELYEAGLIEGGLGLYDWGVHLDVGDRRKWSEV